MVKKKRILIIDNNSSESQIDSLISALEDAAGSKYQIDKPARLNALKDEIRGNKDPLKPYDVIISSGSGMRWRKGEGDYLQLNDPVHRHIKENATNKYVLGICHGAQALGEAYGAKVKNSGIHHRKPRQLQSSHKLFQKEAAGDYHANHKYYIPLTGKGQLETLAIATSGHEKEEQRETFVDAYRVGKHYGIQLHPEKTKAGKEFLRKFLEEAYH